ncbi:glycosyltransferase family protein [Syntrophotalea acetylenica]|jgi:hypothetical protein|uniref:Glycosyl transferase family 2 n=1 Tax=Syntrophotalea acetylenica TaxID=29542 RepID=A0A1L3GI57_SYNAC|nr:hypothetical protein [Syntrophotalea acetylenica]APG25579.1 hypothetical protein A7E75_11535 [Syntrophotalea acetylenica]APG43649.1 hypothetical protein A6070_05565 [Syntrophotalea acetylenica]
MSQAIDVHVLLLPDSNPDWWQECRASMQGEPINLHLVDGMVGHIGRRRARGFGLGAAPYVSCVDPDDLVIPGAFEACLKVLEDHPEACGAYTDQLLIDAKGKVIKPGIWSGMPWNPLLQLEPKYLHPVYVMRRRFMQKYLLELGRWPNMAEFVLKGLITAHGPWIHVNRFGYKWRMSGNAAHKRQSLMHVYAARWRVIPTLQQAARACSATIKVDATLV